MQIEQWMQRWLAATEKLLPKPRREKPRSPQGMAYAGLERRLIAATIDTLILSFLFLPFGDTLMQAAYGELSALQELAKHAPDAVAEEALARAALKGILLLLAVQGMTFWLYSIVGWWIAGTTPGKWLLRMGIVNAKTGKRPSMLQMLLRALAYILSALPLCMGFFAIGWNKQQRGWHDRIAGTAVVALPFRRAPEAADPSDGQAPGAAA